MPLPSTAPNALRDVVAQVSDALRGMWRYRWLGLGVSWLAAIFAVTMALRVPNQYEASARIYDQAQQDRSLHGMGTTLTGILFHGDRGYVVHVGDSRAYLLRSAMACQLTTDHSWLNEQVQAGLITEEEAQDSDLKHIITRSVGFERLVEADIVPVNVNLGDVYLLCSDGFANYVSLDNKGTANQRFYGNGAAGVDQNVFALGVRHTF